MALQERTAVEILIPTTARADDDDPNRWKTIDSLRGIIKGALRDVAE